MEFKTLSEILIYSIDAIELNIDKTVYPALNEVEEILHIVEDEFFYCDLLIDAKLIVTEKQFEELLNIQPISIHKIIDSKLCVHSFSEENRKRYNNKNKRALFVTTENIDEEDEYEVFKLLKNLEKRIFTFNFNEELLPTLRYRF